MPTLREAAFQVLSGAVGPLSYEEITQRAQEQGLLSSTSKTPAASMGAALYMDIKKNPETPFIQTGPGQFALKPGAGKAAAVTPVAGADLTTQVASHNQKVKEKLLASLKEMDPKAFEHLIGRLLERIGYEGVKVTKLSGDGGIDVTATLTVGGVTSVHTAVQVKRYEGNVSGKVVRELRGGIGVQERGLIITTAGFTKDAIAEAAAPNKVPVALVDGAKLVDLLVQKGLGVISRKVEILDLDLESLDPGDGEGGIKPVSGKYQSLWPLPGGDYLAALNAMVEYVAAESPSADSMDDWMRETFGLTGAKVAASYIGVLRRGGLAVYDGSQLTLTEAGTTYLTSQSRAFLLDLFCDRFAGLAELLEILGKGSGTLEELHEALCKRLGVTWNTNGPTRYRLEWLRALGVAARNSEGLWSRVKNEV